MPVFYCKNPEGGELDKDESRHVLKVLRHQIGDELQLVDGSGGRFTVRITGKAGGNCQFDILSSQTEPSPERHIHIAMAPVKSNDRNEFFIEKCVEIGVQEITFVHTANTERPKVNMDRAERTAIAAMKQSGKASIPKLNGLIKLKDFIVTCPQHHKFIAYVELDQAAQLHEVKTDKPEYCCLIGPEGDFSPAEVSKAQEAGFLQIGLGKHVLRAETAGIVACTLLNFLDA